MRLCLFVLVVLLVSLPANVFGRDYYISPSGSDLNDGSKNSPFKTIIHARDTIRKLSDSKRKDDIVVYLQGGTYRIDETVVFGLDDGGVDGHTVTYAAAKGQTPVISSGVKVYGWSKLKSYPAGLPDVAKGNVWVADIPKGVEKFFVMFDGHRRLERARGRGFQMPEFKFKKLATRNVALSEDRPLLRKLPFPEGVIKNWDNLQDVEVFFCGVPWTQNISAIESVDEKESIAWLKHEGNTPPWTTPKPYNPARVENIIDVLDSPGEWCVNTKTRKIYYWPINGEVGDDIIVPRLKEFFRVEGKIDYDGPVDVPVKNLIFKGLTFTHGDRYEWWDGHKGWGIQHDWDKFDHGNAMIRFRGAEDCVVDECRFTNSGNSAIRLDLHAQNITIQNNLIDYVGHMGILLCGYGPGTKDVNKNNRIVNNIIDHCGEVIWHGHAIFVWQSGSNYIANNRIQYIPRKAVGVCGIRGAIFLQGPEIDWDEASNTIRWDELAYKKFTKGDKTQEKVLPYLHAKDNMIENNYIYRARTKIGDGAALNVSGAGEGNVMRRNMLYMSLGNGLRCDDWQRGTTLTENLILSGGIVHKGHNDITNNIFVNTNIRFSFYPGQQPDPGSKILNNVMYFTRGGIVPYMSRKAGNMSTPESCDLQNNVYFAQTGLDKIKGFLDTSQSKGMDKGSIVSDPLFEKPLDIYKRLEPSDFKLRKDSPALKLGFKQIDTGKIDLTDDYPQRYLKEVFAEKRGKLVSANAKITYSSINKSIGEDVSQLVTMDPEVSIPTVYESLDEPSPFVTLELDDTYPVNGLYILSHVFDRQNSMRALTIWASKDNKNWTEIWRVDPYHIGMGRDWDIRPYQVTEAKYIKIGLRPKSALQMQKDDDRIKSIRKNVLVLKNIKVFSE